jgi:hypothetical protein
VFDTAFVPVEDMGFFEAGKAVPAPSLGFCQR